MTVTVEEFAKEKGFTGIYYLGVWKGFDVYSVYNPTDEWIKSGTLYYALKKDGIFRYFIDESKFGRSKIADDLIWDGDLSEEEKQLTYHAPFRKMHTMDGIARVAKDHELIPRTLEEMMQRVELYRNVFGEDVGTWEFGGDPDYVCFAIDYCIKTGTPVDQTPPPGLLY